MSKLSATSLNKLSKCQMMYYLSKSPEGKAYMEKQPIAYTFTLGTLTHAVCQDYDTDRYINGLVVPKTKEEARKRVVQTHIDFFMDEKECKKNRITSDVSDQMINNLIPKLDEWCFANIDEKERKALGLHIKAEQNKLPFAFGKSSLTNAFLDCYEMFHSYLVHGPLDKLDEQLGPPDEVEIEHQYLIKYGDHILQGFADERRVYGDKHYIIEMKTSKTPYTIHDVQIDTQIGLYCFYENVEFDAPLENIYGVMMQFRTNTATITQRTDSQIDLLLSKTEEGLNAVHGFETNTVAPSCLCGTDSFAHSRLLCEWKPICPVWTQVNNSPAPIVLQGKKL